jgi:anti-anti-sigma factor
MVRPTKFEISEKVAGSERIVAVSGELDMNTVEALSQHLDHRALGDEVTGLTLDLRELAFMDSSGLRFLIELNDRSQAEGWRLTLLAPKDEAAAVVLRVTGAEAALPFAREAGS